jgi:hypothetical protein
MFFIDQFPLCLLFNILVLWIFVEKSFIPAMVFFLNVGFFRTGINVNAYQSVAGMNNAADKIGLTEAVTGQWARGCKHRMDRKGRKKSQTWQPGAPNV